MGRLWVYCAGPLFNAKERQEMGSLARSLEAAGFRTFLPQRDGLELTTCLQRLQAMGASREEAAGVISEAIFALDVYQVLRNCHILVANLNGRVPDEGTVSEAAMAWSRGKPVVGYKSDSRTAFAGQDNPLVAGLFEFRLCTSRKEVVNKVKALAPRTVSGRIPGEREDEIVGHCELGHAIWSAMAKRKSVDAVVSVINRFRSHRGRSQCSVA